MGILISLQGQVAVELERASDLFSLPPKNSKDALQQAGYICLCLGRKDVSGI